MHELVPDVVDRNYAKQPLTKAELGRILKALPVAEVMNTRHKVAKENGWKEKAPSKAAFTEAALKEPNLLKRPITLANGNGVVGRSEDAIRELLA